MISELLNARTYIGKVQSQFSLIHVIVVAYYFKSEMLCGIIDSFGKAEL
jgi:hypothetical protein